MKILDNKDEIKQSIQKKSKEIMGTQESLANKTIINKNNEKKLQKLAQKDKKLEFSKRLVLFITINAEMQIWASYILGYLGKEQIAETLSTTVVQTVIYVVICYLIRALIEGLSKNTTMFGKNLPFSGATSLDEVIDTIEEKVGSNTQTDDDSDSAG